MNKIIWSFPIKAKFGRVIPKAKIYEYGAINTALKAKFVDEVDQIIWAYKLADTTVNLSGSDKVPEIQIFTIILKEREVSESVISAIDAAIQFPIIFELKRQVADSDASNSYEICYMASYKRKNEADTSKWVRSNYLKSDWVGIETELSASLPTAINLAELYHHLLERLLPISKLTSETIEQAIERIVQTDVLVKRIAQMQKKIMNEKQFNRKVELNKQLKTLQSELQQLQS